jgi:hypothetical protein
MNRIIVLLSFLVFSISLAIADENSGIVTYPLKMREAPNLKGSLITVLEKGTIVKILEQTESSIKVDNIESPWYKISINKKTGWVFGGFISKEYQIIDRKLNILSWSVNIPTPGGSYSYTRNIVLYDKTKKSSSIIEASPESTDYLFSQNLKYVAVDEGTDVVGGIAFYDVNNGKLINSAAYSPRNFKWEGNALKYNKVICYDDGYTLYEQEIFDNGKTIKTGKYGKGRYHSGVDDGGCEKYKHILSKVK